MIEISQNLETAIDAAVARVSDGTLPPEATRMGYINMVETALQSGKSEEEIIETLNQLHQ